MARSAYLIFNPVAGQGDSEKDLETIKSLLETEISLELEFTSEEVDVAHLVREAVRRGSEAIIASGGDGTISAAAEALVGTTIPLGVISRGTANAFANALGIPDTIEAACQTILQGYTKTIDVANCNGKPMVLLAGVGFEAEAVEQADRTTKNRFGVLAYILSGLQQLQNFKTFDAEIETEDRIIKVLAAAITIANAAPPTSILAQGPAGVIYDDGLLDLTIVAPSNTRAAIAASFHLLQTALAGSATERNDIGYLRAKRIKLTTNPPQKVTLDGEIIGTTPIEVECIPKGLTVFTPMLEQDVPTEKLEGLPNLVIESK
ncbi:MAG: YegS/Rv2252/BmrU family lipid kinase [Scytonema sp. PMC 1069.18]|nr:YegS/Rv2252/BmrU family lipid kinase [Scytonema sp. PMC 1069.18]MEC4880247.1 YegS/Rv2252/BmrU family lipid kinase [Scytonema sp. PMC 1070.18]